jgi:hypothetical protein
MKWVLGVSSIQLEIRVNRKRSFGKAGLVSAPFVKVLIFRKNRVVLDVGTMGMDTGLKSLNAIRVTG